MTRAIYKYVFDPDTAAVSVMMPQGAPILSAQNQDGMLVIWALVDPEAPQVSRAFSVIQTGERFEADPRWPFIGTVQFDDGAYVVHLFDCGEED